MNLAWAITALALLFFLVTNAIYINTVKDKPYKTPTKAFAIFSMIFGILIFMFAVYETTQTAPSYGASYMTNPQFMR